MSINPSVRKSILPGILLIAGLGLAFNKPLTSMVSPAKLEAKIQHHPIIMPAVYKGICE